MGEQNPYWCGDGCCILLVPGRRVGMHTNGGCRCLRDHDPQTRIRVKAGVRWLGERLFEATKRKA